MTEPAPSEAKILITGAAGFLGRQVLRRLVVREGPTLRCLVRPGADPATLERAVADLPRRREVEQVPASFNDTAALGRALQGIETVYHVAASKSGGFAAQVANTVVGTDNLMRAALDTRPSRFVLVSSFSVYGVNGLPRDATVDESTPLEPHPERRDPYVFAKLRQEQLAWDYHREHGIPLVVVRPGVIYGPGSPLITVRIGMTMFGVFLSLGGSNPVPLTHVRNCADAVIAAGTAESAIGEAFNICDDDLLSARQILRLYRKRMGRALSLPIPLPALRAIAVVNDWYSRRSKGNLPVVFSPYVVESMWQRRRFSNAKAKRGLGWRPEISIPEGIEETLDFELRR